MTLTCTCEICKRLEEILPASFLSRLSRTRTINHEDEADRVHDTRVTLVLDSFKTALVAGGRMGDGGGWVSIGKRSPELEDIIMTIPCTATEYAIKIINGRWEKAEDVIMTDSANSNLYSAYAIKDKLPDKMHKMMLLHAIKNPKDEHVIDYFQRLNLPNDISNDNGTSYAK